MTALADLNINFLAFFVSGVLATALGWVWYHPKILGGRWMELRGVDTVRPKTTSPLPYVASFFLWMLAACFYAFLADFLGINTAAGYFCLSCLLWVAFSMPPTLMSAMYTGYPFEAMAIDTSYQLGGYYLFAAVHIVFLYFHWL
ncbi:MAG: DUF1761 domain-containing protein [Micavibrio aeruginosavorus]|uniref:DUF1761 domain-containing protein n=1 Tax=Micavibrio aeruginosavorus TaxID=349221 RepID=A0A2W5N1S3_9BACT|nr:MAG: DUF1761 domain-containing protein [Micavibrio aeruginosavorus]